MNTIKKRFSESKSEFIIIALLELAIIAGSIMLVLR